MRTSVGVFIRARIQKIPSGVGVLETYLVINVFQKGSYGSDCYSRGSSRISEENI